MSDLSRRTFLRGALALPALSLTATAAVGCGTTASAGSLTDLPPTRGIPGEGYLRYNDLAYAAPIGRAHLLDLYVPTTGTGPFPVVIYQAGSAFGRDDTKSDPLPTRRSPRRGVPESSVPAVGRGAPTVLAEQWAPHGYAVVGLNVRSSAQARFPGLVHDAKAAIRYLRANARIYQLDVHRFATMGTSSGAWVSVMAGVTSGNAEFDGNLGNAGQSSAVQAVIDLYGPTDFLAEDAHRLPGGLRHDPPDSPESRLMGFPITTNPAAVARTNPGRYVTATSPPAYIVHGTADPIVPYQQSELLFAAYQRAGAPATLTLIPKAGHGDGFLTAPGKVPGRTVQRTEHGRTTTAADPAPTYDTLRQFLDTVFRPAP
jgi:acetyl esterase/lipase